MASKYGVYGASLTGNWQRLGDALGTLSVRFPQAMQRSLAEEAEFYRRKMVEGIRDQAPGGEKFKPLQPITIALRKVMGFHGTKALIRTGELRNNIQAVVEDGVAFVGILYTARGANGKSLADIGRIHEFGATIRAVISRAKLRMIQAAMRKLGNSPSGGGGRGLGVVTIPPRPFIGPTFRMWGGKRGADRFMARVARKLGGLLGVINHPDLGGRGLETIPEKLVAGGQGASVAKGMRMMRGGLGKGRGGTKKSASFNRMFMGLARRGGGPGVSKTRGTIGSGMMKMFGGRGPKLKAPPRIRRTSKLIKPRNPMSFANAVKRVASPRTARGARAPRAPRAPRVPKQPKPPPAAKIAMRAQRYNQRQAKAQNRAATAFARQNQAATKRQARAAQKVKVGQQRAQQRKVARVQKAGQKALAKQVTQRQRAAAQAAQKQLKQIKQARKIAAKLRPKPPRAPRPSKYDSHVKAHRKRESQKRSRENKKSQHDSHVRAMRSGQHDAHVRARRAHQRAERKKGGS